MKKLFGRLSIIVLALAPLSMAQVSDPPPSASPSVSRYSNAALEYWKIWETMDAQLVDVVFLAEQETLAREGSPAWNALVKLQPDIQALIRASQMPICDWQIDYSRGFDTELPHLGKVRRTARLLVFDGRRLIGTGDIEAATTRAIAAMSTASQIGQDNFLIGSLVGMAIASLSCELTNEILDSGKATQADRDRLLAALGQFNEVDPFYVVDAIAIEREIAVQWIEREFTGEDSRSISGFLAYMGGEDASTKDNPLAKFTNEDFVEDLAKLDTAYEALLAAWNADDPFGRFAVVTEGVRAGQFGEVAKLVLPPLDNIRRSSNLVDATLKATRARLVETPGQSPDAPKNPTPDSDG